MSVAALALMCALSAPECRSDDARRIATAIDAATDDDRLRAVEVVYSYDESRWSLHPACWSWDCRRGLARGPFQLWHGGDRPLEEQARGWLRLVQAAGLAGVDSSPTRATRRARRAERLLAAASPP